MKITCTLIHQVPVFNYEIAYENEYEERPQEKLECLIMEEVFKLEKKDGIFGDKVDNISEDVEDKLKEIV